MTTGDGEELGVGDWIPQEVVGGRLGKVVATDLKPLPPKKALGTTQLQTY